MTLEMQNAAPEEIVVGPFRIGRQNPLVLIGGPCVIEPIDTCMRIASEAKDIAASLGIPYIFKASYDKANRTNIGGYRGPGLENGLNILRRVKEEIGVPVTSDVHEVGQVVPASEVLDLIQIPAALCKQVDLLLAAGSTGRPVNIKKGQWMAPEEMAAAVGKARAAGASQVAVTERGTSFGYGDLVVDMRSFRRMQCALRVPVIFDGTHSVQRPGKAFGSSGGDPEYIVPLVRSAVAAGCEGLFIEVHPNPTSAPSDGKNMLPLDQLGDLLESALAIRDTLAGHPSAPISKD